MKKTGAWLTRYALEQLGVRHVFGIPGVHITELYDEFNNSKQISPHLVVHEGGASFIADAISRTSDSIGTIVVVPAAGLTHAMSGIGEAFLDGIPMLVISGGTRRDTGKRFQLHELDHQSLLAPITKKTFVIESHDQIIPTLYEAYYTATSGCPGPVYVEIPVEIQLFQGHVPELLPYSAPEKRHELDPKLLEETAKLIQNAKNPCIFAGWGCVNSADLLVQFAEALGAPVATTLQGLSVFPHSHPLHTGMGFSEAAVPAATEMFRDCDVLIAVGTRFAEIPTGSFGVKVPENLIHVDIDSTVLNQNYKAKIAITADSKDFFAQILTRISPKTKSEWQEKADKIASLKTSYFAEWKKHDSGERVNPLALFDAVNHVFTSESYLVVDDGNHTFLAAELMKVENPKHFISPTDFNCMGYAVPASIGVKLTHPENDVICVAGDGAFAMTCMEIATASENKLGVVFLVFNDGELSQISQGQSKPYNRKTCTILSAVNFEGVAKATGAEYFSVNGSSDLEHILVSAREIAHGGKPVIVDVAIDYSKETRFTKGVVKTNLNRFPLKEKLRFVGRAIGRKITG